MSDPLVRIEGLDPSTADESDFAAFNACSNALRAEGWPDDPPLPVDETIRSLSSVPAFIELQRWIGRRAEDGAIVAISNASAPRTEAWQVELPRVLDYLETRRAELPPRA